MISLGRGIRGGWIAAWLWLGAIGLAPVVAAASDAPRAVGVLDVARAVLQHYEGVLVGREEVRIRDAVWLSARGAFDPALGLDLSHEHQASSLAGTGDPPEEQRLDTSQAELALDKRFRTGLEVRLSAGVTRDAAPLPQSNTTCRPSGRVTASSMASR